MAATYEPIASTTVTAASTFSFTSIPGTYTDLVLVYAGTSSGSPNTYRFNGDSGTNYSDTYLLGTGSAASSGRYSTQTASRAAIGPGGGQHIMKLLIQSYANTSVYKTTLTEQASSTTYVERLVSLWRSTSAITSLVMTCNGGTFTGTASLYGIKAA